MKLNGKVALITGGASGLGEGTAEMLVRSGTKVILLDTNEALGNDVAGRLGKENALFCKADVTDEISVGEAIAAGVEKFGGLHICVNCAGIGTSSKTLGKSGPFPMDLFQKIINVNLVGTFNVMRLCAEQMSKQEPEGSDQERGVIINTASIAAFEGQVGQLGYSASKGGVVAMTLPAARDLASFGIRVLCIAPGIIDTPMLSNQLNADIRNALISNIQFPKRLGLPSDFAITVMNLVENSYLNGEVIRMDAALRLTAR